MQTLKYFYAGVRMAIFNMTNQYKIIYDVAGYKPFINFALFAVPRLAVYIARRQGRINRKKAWGYYASIETIQIASWFVTPFMTREQMNEMLERSFDEAAEYTNKLLDEIETG